MVAVNFNTGLVVPEGAERDKEITAALSAVVLEDILANFRPL